VTHYENCRCIVPLSTPWFNSFTNRVEIYPWSELRGAHEMNEFLRLTTEVLSENLPASESWLDEFGAWT
jgi:hypothetical protein